MSVVLLAVGVMVACLKRPGADNLPCTEGAVEAAVQEDHLVVDWRGLYSFYQRYKQCDEAAVVGESFSGNTVHLLAKSWGDSAALWNLVDSDPVFRSFLLRPSIPQLTMPNFVKLSPMRPGDASGANVASVAQCATEPPKRLRVSSDHSMGMIVNDPLLPADPFWSRERTLALIVVLIDVAIAWMRYDGAEWIVRAASPFVPLLLVWFPDAMGYLSWAGEAGHGRAPLPAPDAIVRAVGWIGLLYPIVIFGASAVASRI